VKHFPYHIKQPVLFSIIVLIKTKAYFVNLANIFTETNLLQKQLLLIRMVMANPHGYVII